MVKPFDQWDGIHQVVSGYTGGHLENPTYEDVKRGDTGHYEAVEITYDPSIISYEKILEVYWRQSDPTDDGGQFRSEERRVGKERRRRRSKDHEKKKEREA